MGAQSTFIMAGAEDMWRRAPNGDEPARVE
jgi:hypothetical protein